MERILDWVPRFDERSRNYPITAIVGKSLRPRNRTWKPGQILDQGSEGACVGFGWTAEALATPVKVSLDRVKADIPRDPTDFSHFVYKSAQRIDEWEGENYSGTSVLAGAKVMKEVGTLKEYRWAFSTNDLLLGIAARGPAVLGIPWYDSMYEAPNGVVSVKGRAVGGHCITAVGYRTSSKHFDGAPSVVLVNSWGPEWGNNGVAEISVSDLDRLLQSGGEACIPVGRSYGR